MKVYNLKDNLKYLDEVLLLEYNEWAKDKEFNKEERLIKKKEKIINMFNHELFCKLALVEDNKLLGFISLFPEDGEEEKDLYPWYATMYVKEEYRGRGYSKILNDALLNEARIRGFKVIYLKTTLSNYYEKFGAVFIKDLRSGDKLYKIDL